MLKRGFVGRGMRLEFSHPAYRAPITTSHDLAYQGDSRVSETLRRAWSRPECLSNGEPAAQL
jgi:hypothetical protein